MKTIFIDNISFYVFIKLIFLSRSYIEIKVLNDPNKTESFFIRVLIFFGYRVNIESFFYGDLHGSSGEALTFISRKKASLLALEFSKFIMNDKEIIKFGKKSPEIKNIIELFISKKTMMEFEYYVLRVEYINKIHNDKADLWVKNSLLINSTFIQNSFKSLNIVIYKSIKKEVFFFLKKILKIFLMIFKSLKKVDLQKKTYHLVALASDEINLNTDKRHFPHWFKKNKYQTLILNMNLFPVKISKEDCKKNKISIVDKINALSFFNQFQRRFFKLSNQNHFPIQLISLIKELFFLSENCYYLFKKIKCKKFIYIDPQQPITDAVQLISADLKIKTICIQYSNLGLISPVCIPSCDHFLIFSNMYKNVFKWRDLGPKSFSPIGYSFIQENELQNQFEKKIDKDNFVISYFDESVQNDKWGLFSEEKNIILLEKLATLVIKNEKIVVVLKPQFVFNTIKKYNSSTIKKALETNRFLELSKGLHRNEITPFSVAKISNFCISHALGATAALEVALCKKPVVLLNEEGFISEFAGLYKKGNIIYNSIDEVLDLISMKLIKENFKIGDWSKIIDDFSSNHEISKELINNLILDD